MKITKEELKKKNPCEEGFKYWCEKGIDDLAEFMWEAYQDGHFDYAHWLFVRFVPIKTRIKYAVFAAELVLDIYEREYPEDNRPRAAIEAAKKVIESDTTENRPNAAFAAYAAYTAANAAANATNTASIAASFSANAAANAAEYAAKAAEYAADAAEYAADTDTADATKTETQKKIIEYAITLIKEQE